MGQSGVWLMLNRGVGLVSLIIAVVGAMFAAAFFLYAATSWGHLVAIWGLAGAFLPLALYLRQAKSHSRWHWNGFILILLMVVVGGAAAILFSTPPGDARPGSPISQHFSRDTTFHRFSLTNIVPEAEQVNMGFLVGPFLDRIFTYHQAQRVSQFTLDIYEKMDASPDFARLGSAMGWTYAELVGLPFDVGHYYLYVPENRSDDPLPAIVFLHGSVGNFKAYTWVWSQLAEEMGYVIIAPSFGFGNWHQPGGLEAVFRAIEDAKAYVSLDEERIYLAGLSNGGLGVSLASNAAATQFHGLIFLSPVFATDVVETTAFYNQWFGRPVLIITGEADERISLRYVDERVQHLQNGGLAVTYITYPNEDHFLFFSQREAVLADISQWLQEAEYKLPN